MFYWVAYYICWATSFFLFPITIRGREHMPPRGSYVLASNHISNLDPVIIGMTLRRLVNYMAKDTLFKNKIFGFIISQLGAFPIKRETSDISAIRQSIRRLRAGETIVVFPQGTRKEKFDADDPGQKGVGFLVARCGVPVIPVYIEGTDQVLPSGGRFFKRRPITITYGPMISFSGKEPYQQITQRIMQEIARLAPA